jgi:phosphatidylglycerol:prolipoprotein diacylglycerol transferase
MLYFIFTANQYYMYPTLYHFFYDVFGLQIDALQFFPAFGFIVAMSFIAAAFFFGRELKRKEQAGFLFPITEKVLTGKPASVSEMVTNGIIGFIFGYKILGIFFGSAEGMVMKDYMFSKYGSWTAGLLLAAAFAYMKYREKEKDKLPEPKWVDAKIYPSQRVGEITMVAALAGIIGAKVFHQFEYWEEFKANPMESLLSPSGLTFYGGLICGAIAVVYYVRKRQMNPWVIADAVAPSLILAYAIGRIGCQVSGDGDWGIESTSPKPGWMSFLPDWMWSYNFPHNVNEVGVPMANCDAWAPYCNQLPVGVYPTAFYEVLMGFTIFGILWMVRKRITTPGVIFCLYLIFNGLERFTIEQIRVNSTFEFIGITMTQAQLISFILMLVGTIGIIYFKMTSKKAQ